MSGRRPAIWTAPLVGVVVLVSACGVPTGGEPEAIAASEIPPGLTSATPSSAPAPPVPPSMDEPGIYWVTADEVLVPRGRTVGEGTREQRLTRLLADLAAGPTSRERVDELTTALPPGVSLDVTAIDDETATIDITAAENTLSDRETRRAVGQIVLTATTLPGIREVLLTRDGEPVEAPLPSGRLTSEPLTAEDYTALLTSPPP